MNSKTYELMIISIYKFIKLALAFNRIESSGHIVLNLTDHLMRLVYIDWLLISYLYLPAPY